MENTELPKYLESIFYPLYEHATDLECKLMLLDEILAVGDKRDIPFLAELEKNKEGKIRKRALEVKRALQKKLGVGPKKEARRLPMSLCFIYDEFNIGPDKTEADLDFEIALEIMAMEK